MPWIDGYEVAAKMREIAPAEDTGDCGALIEFDCAETCFPEQLQIARKLSKPIRRAELHDAIASCWGKNSKQGSSADPDVPPARKKTSTFSLLKTTSLTRKLAIRLLEKMGQPCPSRGKNGREAVELPPRLNFDLILMDLQMPVMGGPRSDAKNTAIRSRRRQIHSDPCDDRPRYEGRPGKMFRSRHGRLRFETDSNDLLKDEIARLSRKGPGERPMNTCSTNSM